MTETQRGVATEAALAFDDLGNPVGRHPDLPRQFGRADAEQFKLVGENLAGVNCGTSHQRFLSAQ